MGGGRALWMLYVPCPEGLWSLPVMPIRLSPSLSSHTLFGYWPITTTTGILNKWGLAKAWGLDLWFSDSRPTASSKDLWADSSKSMSQQQDFAGHLWFPEEGPRITGNQALRWVLAVHPHIWHLTRLDSVPFSPALLWPPDPLGGPVHVCYWNY